MCRSSKTFNKRPSNELEQSKRRVEAWPLQLRHVAAAWPLQLWHASAHTAACALLDCCSCGTQQQHDWCSCVMHPLKQQPDPCLIVAIVACSSSLTVVVMVCIRPCSNRNNASTVGRLHQLKDFESFTDACYKVLIPFHAILHCGQMDEGVNQDKQTDPVPDQTLFARSL